MMKKIMILIFMILITSIRAQVDYFELAKLMYRNNNILKAQENLSRVKSEEVDSKDFYRLSGLIDLKLQRFNEAITAFEKVESLKKFNKDIYLYHAQAAYGLKNNQLTLDLLKKGNLFIQELPKFYLLSNLVNFDMGNLEQSWSYLQIGLNKFPENMTLKKQKWLMLLNLKLYQESFVWLVDNKSLWKQLDFLQFAGEYRNRQLLRQALATGEMARLLFPRDTDISMELVKAYIQNKKIFAAADLLDQIASLDHSYAGKASELWRQSGNIQRASYWSTYIYDKDELLKQKLSLAISAKDFEKVSHLSPLIERSKLIQSEDIQYALAYASLMNNELVKANNFMKGIAREDLIKKVLVLRTTLESCKQRPDQCL